MVWIVAFITAVIPAMALGTPIAGTDKLAGNKEVIDFVTSTCTMHGSQDKIPEVMGIIEKFQICAENLTNDLEKIVYSDVSRNGDISGLIKKYCGLAPQLKNCTYSLLDFISMCGDKDDKEDIEDTRYLVDQLVDYACHKDGERITSFLKEGGGQCVQKNSKALGKCMAFIADQIEGDDDEDNSEENDVCEVFEHSSNCILSSMNDCAETPVKITRDASAHLRKVLSCTSSEDNSLYKHWLQSHTTLN